MRRFLLLFLVLSLIFIRSPNAANMTSYCYAPPYVGQAVSPNVMLLIDVSGSMSWCAYNPDFYGTGCCPSPFGCGWTYKGTEEGYFDPSKVYRYNFLQGYWEETTGTPAPCPKSAYLLNVMKLYSGSCLNFLYMTRIDLVRWALTGGTLDSCPTGVNQQPQNNISRCDPETYGQPGSKVSCDSYGCVLKSYLGVRVKVPWSRINSALLFQLKTLSFKPRMGVMFFGDRDIMPFSGSGIRDKASVYIGDFTASENFDALNPYKNTITAVNEEDPSGETPTAPALWDTYNYFAQQNPQYGGLKPQQGGGDQWRNPMYQCFDSNGDGKCEGSEFKLVPCAKNFVILMTDGQWNVGGPPNAVSVACTIDYGFERYSADPVVPAYWLHKKGFTNAPTGINSKVEAIYGIGLFLGGTGEQALKNISMYGSFETTGRDWPDSLSGYPQGTCWMDDCGYGKGSGCTPLPPSSPDWDKNSDGVPDTFYSASDANQIKNSILSAILDILRRASSGATVATLTSRVGISSLIVQPYYYPKYIRQDGTEVSWLGFLRSFWIDTMQNLREDTTEPKVLNIAGTVFDKIFQFFFDPNSNETKVAILQGSDTTTSCVMEGTKSINEVIPVFDAGCQLANRDPSDRNILYNKNGTLTPFTTSESNYLSNIWKICSNDPTVLCTKNGDCSGGGTCQAANASCIIRYLRGEDLSSDSSCPDYVKRPREVDIANFCPGASGLKTWRIGDIINSTPSVVSSEPVNIYHLRYNDTTYLQYIRTDAYKNRTTFVFVGANDGMLHAFRVGRTVPTEDTNRPTMVVNAYNTMSNDLVGREEWAFIPRNALPYLVWYGNPNYCRVPTVDYRTAVFDVSIGGPATADKTVNSWRTILIGTMGFGGMSITTSAGTFSSSVFALDLTDWLNGTSAQPTLLWEVSLPDGTLTTSFPAVVRLGDPNKNGEWYVVIGSGPLNPNGTSFTSQPKLYFIDLRTGSIVRSVNIPATGGVNFAVGDIAVVDVDNDYQDDVIYFGVYGRTNAGNVWGNFYRLSLKSGSGYKSVSALTSSDICTAIDLSTFATGGNTPPVFGAPDFTKDENGKLWVFFGTGRYVMDSSDKTIPYDNYLIGFKDENWNSGTCPAPYTKAQLTDVTDQPLTITVTDVKQICMCDANGCGMQNVVYNADGSTPQEPPIGWYYRLTGEAIYSQPLVIGGIVDALTYVPPQDICQMEGSSNLISVYYKTGRPSPRPSVLSPNVVRGTIAVGQSVQLLQKISVGQGIPPIGNPFQALQSSQASQQLEKFAQVSTGVVLRMTQQKAITSEEKFLIWIEK